jgi:septal ring factor EnvC (AmiA/AmiB activator)
VTSPHHSPHFAARPATGVVHFLCMPPKKQTSDIARLTNTVERGFAALAEDIGKLDSKIDKVEARLDHRLDKVDANIDRLDTKLTKFEERELDKRMQLEVRVATIEKHLGLDKKIAA